MFLFWLVWVAVGMAIGYAICRAGERARKITDLEFQVAEEYRKIKSKKDNDEA